MGGAVLVLVVVVAVFAPWLAPFDPNDQDVWAQLEPPSALHWMGTDENGRDVLSNVIWGARPALITAFAAVAVSLLVGVAVGAPAAYAGGRWDNLVMRVCEVVMSFPGILLALLVLFVTQEPSLWSVVLALSITGWAGYARFVRGQVVAERSRAYVEAARAMGLPAWRVLFVHVLPNTAGPLIVQATFGMGTALLAEASLSFLGLGPQGQASWGALVDQGAQYFLLTPHLAIFPGTALVLTVVGINFVGDGLRDVLDPRQS
jgi:peptide/nickel transport system permease protein